MNQFDLKKFLKNHPIISALAIVFVAGAVGVRFGHGLWRKNVVGHYQIKGVLKPEALRKQAIAAPTSGVAIPIAPLGAARERLLRAGKRMPAEPLSKEAGKPRIVFVIDDIGYSKRYADLLFSIDRPVTLAILPELAYSKYFSEEAKKNGFETILHLPLEPEDPGEDPGPGAIRVDMSSDEVRAVLEKDLASVPGVMGANNHMGSQATRDRRLMYLITKELKRRQLFFLDSMTHPNSVAYDVAYALGVPALKRDVFLDNRDDFDYIMEQIEEVARTARQAGHAVAIGHIRENTLLAVKKAIPRLEAQGFELSTLGDLTEKTPSPLVPYGIPSGMGEGRDGG